MSPSADTGPVDVLAAVLADLTAEAAWLDALLAPLDDNGWRTPTPDADRWLDIAQAFAGSPGNGRPPAGRSRR